jgi:chromosome segregation ATPase
MMIYAAAQQAKQQADLAAQAERDQAAAKELAAKRAAEEASAESLRAWEADQVRREIEFQISERSKAAEYLQAETERLRALIATPASTAEALAAQAAAQSALTSSIDALNAQISMLETLQRSRQSGLDDAKAALAASTKTFSDMMTMVSGRLNRQMALVAGGMVAAAIAVVMIGRRR